jgi:hypothetical protein
MVMGLFEGPSRRFLAPYYMVHAALPAIYLGLRLFVWAPEKLLWLKKSQAFLGVAVFARELEVLLLLLLVVLSRFRRAATWDHFLVSLALFAKTYIAVMLWNVDTTYLTWYAITVAVLFVALRTPRYDGPTKVRKLDVSNFQATVIDGPRAAHLGAGGRSSSGADGNEGGAGSNNKKKRKGRGKGPNDGDVASGAGGGGAWLVEVTAGWHTSSTLFAPMFAELSLRFSTEELSFGTIDVARRGNAEIAESFHINTGARSKQLPSYILFEHGKEVQRLPPIDKKTKEVIAENTTVRKEGLIQYFALDRRLLEFRKRKYAHT